MANNLAALQQFLGARARAQEPLARHTTLRIGGPADLWVEAKSTVELIEWSRQAWAYGVPVLVIGHGSNLLVLDGGVRGLVIENRADKIRLQVTDSEHAILEAESGASLPLMANQLARQGWSGLEWAIGVPGTIGGAVVGNAGAHGSSIADRVLKTTVLSRPDEVSELTRPELQLTYRGSRFKGSREYVILSAELALGRQDPQTCIARMKEYTEHRRRTQPTEPSVGSMFKNPPGDFAGRLIEQAGLKGARVGSVQVSPVHANFFVNHGPARAEDMMRLIEIVQGRVKQVFGLEMELEIQLVGDPVSPGAG